MTLSNGRETRMPVDFFIDLDRSGPIPLYFQVANRIEQAIRSGELPAGSRIENEISLSNRLGLSRPTVRRAIQEVAEKGLIVRRRGIGTEVVHGPTVRRMSLTSLYEDLRADGKAPTTQVLDRRLRPCGEDVAEQLGCTPETEVLWLKRLRFSDDEPVALMVNFLPAEFDDLTSEQLEQHGMYQLLRARGVAMKVASQRIGARRSTPQERRLLKMFPSDPLLTMARVAYDSSGRAVEVGHHAFRPDLYSIEVTLVDR